MSEVSVIMEIRRAWGELGIPDKDAFQFLEIEAGEDAVECLCGKRFDEVDTACEGFEAITLMWLPPKAAVYYLATYLCDVLEARARARRGEYSSLAWGVLARQNIFTLLDSRNRAEDMLQWLTTKCKLALARALVLIHRGHQFF